MSDYEVLLAMCATFFASVDKVFGQGIFKYRW